MKQTSKTNGEALADWVVGFRLEHAGDDLREKAKDLLLDHLGVMLAGAAEEESARVAFEYAASLGGSGKARLFRRDAPAVSAEAAAFAHATAAHSIEMDDVHNASSLHPGVVSIPAAVALAEECGSTGRDLLQAIIAAYEIVLRVGEAAGPSALYRRGFHPTAVCGVFSSAAAAGKLMGLSARQMLHAFGLAWSFAAGNMSFQTEGSWAKRLQIGNTVRCGVQAARLASLGATGPSRVFERDGFFQSYSGEFHEEKLVGGLGDRLKLEEVGIKPFACCRYNQTPVDGLLELRAKHHLKPEEIERIDIEIASTGLPLVAVPADAKRRPAGSVEAQFSLYYSSAVALVAGAAGRDEYREPWLSDPRVLDLASRVHVGSNSEIDRKFPAKWGTKILLRTRAGQTIEHAADDCLGDPEKPLGRAGLIEKFRSLTRNALAPAARDRAVQCVMEIDQLSRADALNDAILAGLD